MLEPFGHLVATLHKAQGTMGPQLHRLSSSRSFDKVRLPRLQNEARQLKGAATALLVRLMQREASPDLIVQTKALAAFFENAEQQAASLLQNQRHANSDVANDHDNDTQADVEGAQEHEEPVQATGTGSSRLKAASGTKARNAPAVHRLAQMRLCDPQSAPEGHLRKRGSRPHH